MSKKRSEKSSGKRPEVDLGFSGKGLLGGFFKGFSGLMELADKLDQEGGVEKTGEFGVKGQKDMSGVYGFSIRTMAGPGGVARPVVRPFGDIAKVKKTARPTRPKGPIVEEAREPLVDAFDEGDFIRVVAELPGVGEEEIVCEVAGDDVVQLSTTGKKKYSKELLLPARVEHGTLTKQYTNGVLELKLHKKKAK